MKVILVLLAFVAAASAVRIVNCRGSAAINTNDIQITGCSKQSRKCFFKRGQDAELTLPFTPKMEITQVKAEVTAYVSFLPIPFKLPNENGCLNSNLQCPLAVNQQAVYKSSLPIKSSYPPISLDVQWVLKDQNSNKLVCIKFPVQVKS